MAKTAFLHIRLTPEDHERLQRVAAAEHLEASTWARRLLLQAMERWESRNGQRLRVAEGPAEGASGRQPRRR